MFQPGQFFFANFNGSSPEVIMPNLEKLSIEDVFLLVIHWTSK